ncbi:SPOR domain-containing protein [Marinicella litoralis]|uniref:Sporulation related protein n=1 Tax=Marinicella litoralis TaxID=644220 RepID=A0A4R6XZP6_9GAMM|nr:SPOR domain-containing protein [Marinicella litoralis]TDR23273.1 sporulation related protein [Marinicella litoralis]
MTTKKAVRKTTKKRTARKAGHKRPVPGWIILLSGVLSGLLLAVFIYVKGWVPEPIQNTQNPVPGVAQETVKPVEDVSKTVSKKPDYDFYSVLPEMEVVIPKEELEQQAARDSKEYSYILQVGSFKSRSDAEELKARIAFSGQIAHIQEIKVNGTQYHRVRVGPFDSSREADKQKRQLEQGGHKPLVLKETKP